MKALQQLVAPDAGGIKESEPLLEINTRRHTEYTRGIKRQCLAAGQPSGEDDGIETSSGRGRSFLETKWEEVSRKKRSCSIRPYLFTADGHSSLTMIPGKLPASAGNLDEHEIAHDPQLEEDEQMTEIHDLSGGTTSNEDSAVQGPENIDESSTLTLEPSDIGAAYPDTLAGEAGRLPNEKSGATVDVKSLDNVDQDEIHNPTTTDAAEDAEATDDALDVETAADQQLQSDVATITQAAENQDTMADPGELTAEQESTLVRSALRSSMDGDDTALLNNFLSKAKAKREAKAVAEAEVATTVASDHHEDKEQEPAQEHGQEDELPTPQHQVFVEIPTPERRALEDLDANSPSPQKSPSKPAKKDENTGENASPVARRSTRVRSLQRAAAPGGLRTTFSLRRARGNEFVFLQKTEAQELALQTRRNTKQNKGDALLPKYALKGMSKKSPDSSPVTDEGRKTSGKPKKCVSWNEERLFEIEGEESDDELAQDTKTATAITKPAAKRAANNRNSQSNTSLKTGTTKTAAAATTASPTAATRGRRARRLGPPKPLEPSTDNSADAASPLSPAMGIESPAKRKKLTPKSPKQTISWPKTPSKLPTATASNNEVPSLLSSGRSVKTNLLKVNAGSTPMPKRVRRP